jgi:hypothetical protein
MEKAIIIFIGIIFCCLITHPVLADDTVDELIDKAGSDDHSERIQAIRALGVKGDLKAVPVLVGLISKDFDNMEERDETFSVLAVELRNFDSDDAFESLKVLEKTKPVVMVDWSGPECDQKLKRAKYNWVVSAQISRRIILSKRATKEITKIITKTDNRSLQARNIAEQAWKGKGANQEFREAATRNLEKLSEEAVQEVLLVLDDAKDCYKLEIIKFLKKMYVENRIENGNITNSLIRLIESKCEEVRVEAVRALGDIADPSSEEELIETAIKHKSKNYILNKTGYRALRALGPWCTDEAIKIIVDQIGTKNGDGIPVYLKNFGDRVIPYAEKPLFSKNRREKMRMVRTLLFIGTEKANKLLEKYVEKNPEDKEWIMNTIDKNKKNNKKGNKK